MCECKMDKAKNTFIIVGRTADGFLKFLKENNLNTIDPELLADYIIEGIINFGKDDRDASNLLLNEIWDIVGAQDPDTALEVTRQFAKLCDMYRSILQDLSGKVNLSEEL